MSTFRSCAPATMKNRFTLVLSFALIFVGACVMSFANVKRPMLEQRPAELPLCESIRLVYYDKPYKTGSSWLSEKLTLAFATTGDVDHTLCDHNCRGVGPNMTVVNKLKPGSVDVSIQHKAWSFQHANLWNADVPSGVFTLTTIRNPSERYMSWYTYIYFFARPGARSPGTHQEEFKQGEREAFFAMTTHNPFSLHDFYRRGEFHQDTPQYNRQITGAFHCIIELSTGVGMDALRQTVERLGGNGSIFTGPPHNVTPGKANGVNFSQASKRLAQVLAPEYNLYAQFRDAALHSRNCKCR
jgi:hypothetical protein